MRSCQVCGCSIDHLRRDARVCGTACRRRRRWLNDLASREERPCANPFCVAPVPVYNNRDSCSAACSSVVAKFKSYGKAAGESQAIHAGFLLACRVQFLPCRDCGALVTAKLMAKAKRCAPCLLQRQRDHASVAAQRRRAIGRGMSVAELLERDGNRCHLCLRKIDMTLRNRHKWQASVDHLIPVSQGGTNSPENLALAHLHCNRVRSATGPAQLRLVG